MARIQALQEELDYLRSQEAPPSPPVEAVVIEETSFVVGKGEEPVPNPRRKRANAPPTFREAHWGIDPKRKEPFDVPDPRDNTAMIALGELVAATYGTKKGGDKRITDYEHTFERKRPMLCYGNKDGKLYVVGGDYKVEKRGIVG